MKLTVVNWRNICDEIRYWDAMDLLRNLDCELENANKGFANCLFCSKSMEEGGRLLLTPDIAVHGDRMELSFPNLEGVDKDDIDVTIENGEISVNVELEGEDGKSLFGWFRMRIPQDFDADSCDAEHKGSALRICLKRKAPPPSKKKIKLK